MNDRDGRSLLKSQLRNFQLPMQKSFPICIKSSSYLSAQSQIGTLGINHLTSTFAQRTKMATAFQQLFGNTPATRLNGSYVLLVTCNRVEIYFSSNELIKMQEDILHLLQTFYRENLKNTFYYYFGNRCFLHLSRVICGLNSACIGESGIKKQVKNAYERFKRKQQLSSSLHHLFQKSFKIAKEFRSSHLAIDKNSTLLKTIYLLLQKLIQPTIQPRILFVGNSEMNRQIIRFLQFKSYGQLTLCTRMIKGTFATRTVRDWAILKEWQTYDVVILATYHSKHVLDRSLFRAPLKKPIFLFDLGVPPNVNPDLAQEAFVRLYNIDHLNQIISEEEAYSKSEIELYEDFVRKTVCHQMKLLERKKQRQFEYSANHCKEVLWM